MTAIGPEGVPYLTCEACGVHFPPGAPGAVGDGEGLRSVPHARRAHGTCENLIGVHEFGAISGRVGLGVGEWLTI
jgi:hypothetical protein